jgi:serine/threonine protein phosphatase PrpC
MSSDGLYDFVKREEIRPIVERNGEAVESSCEELKDKALLAGSGQTITVIVIHGHSR